MVYFVSYVTCLHCIPRQPLGLSFARVLSLVAEPCCHFTFALSAPTAGAKEAGILWCCLIGEHGVSHKNLFKVVSGVTPSDEFAPQMSPWVHFPPGSIDFRPGVGGGLGGSRPANSPRVKSI